MLRRDFLKFTSAASALAVTPKVYRRAFRANSKVGVAVIGLHGRGKDHLGGFGDHVVAVCDCDREVLAACEPEKTYRRFTDYRELLDAPGIDAVSIATPNHTHALIAIAAIRAGKDVYVEKPVSHNVWEGRQIVAAAREHNAIVQCGTQSRSSPSLQSALEYMRRGEMGAVQYAIGTCYKPRKSIGKLDRPLTIPPTVDYELWCGPAEKRELYRPNLHYDWHWDFNTGNGDMGNQGIHQMDIARWFLGETTLSKRILSVGGRLGYEDAADTPNTQAVLHEFDKTFLIFETRGLPKAKQFQAEGWGDNMDSHRGSTIGVIVQCEGGHLLIPSYTEAIAFDNEGRELKRWEGGSDHYANFIAAVEADDRSLLNADIEEGHLSSALCHTGGISHQLGSRADMAGIKKLLPSNAIFADAVERMLTHLRANGVDIDGSPSITWGADLTMSGAEETFLSNDEASRRLTRHYREPFVIEGAVSPLTRK